MLKRNFQPNGGTWLTLVLSLVILYIFFGNILNNPNQVFFSSGGDGLQNYYNHIYHVKYDSTYFRSSGMNYPYGEMIYFTGAQLLPVSLLKYIDNNVVSISEYMIGIQNMMMLLSIVLGALFLFLIFRLLKLPAIESSLFAVAIAYLSPQLDRFGGHFSLAYVFVVPLVFYLYMLFFRKPGLWLSLIIGLIGFWAYTTQPYFFGMLAVVWLFYWAYWFFFKKKKEISYLKATLFCFIQLIMPYIFVQVFASLYDPVTDRTAAPWGFLFYRAYPESVFLPFGKSYGKFLNSIFKSTKYIQWEGVSYIGLIGIAGFVVLLRGIYIKIKTKKYSKILDVTENRILNIFFWASLAALLYSFGIPYILGMEWLLDYSGPLMQLRGIGRFAWIFFYLINIVSVYFLLMWTTTNSKKIILWIALLVIGYDAYLNVRSKEYFLNNKILELADQNNLLPQNEWVKIIDPTKYQAIIPIPYFNVGSENIWVAPLCDDLRASFIASLKIGIPSTGIFLSRTSISQSYKNYSLILEPYRKPEILKDYPNHKPLLLLVSDCEYEKGELNLINNSELIYKGQQVSFYEISYQKLEHLADSLYYKTNAELKYRELKQFNGFYYSEGTCSFVYTRFDSLNSSSSYIGAGAVEADCDKFTKVFSGQLPNYETNKDYLVSFWYGNILTDLVFRSTIILSYADSTGKTYKEDYISVNKGLKIIDENWALCEFKFRLNNPKDIFSVLFTNPQLRNGTLLVDELIIRPENSDIFSSTDKGIIKNNRLYLKTN